MPWLLTIAGRRRTGTHHEPLARNTVPPAENVDAQPFVAETCTLRMPLSNVTPNIGTVGSGALHPLQQTPLAVLAHIRIFRWP